MFARTTLDFTFREDEAHPVDDILRLGITQLTEHLFLGGEEDVSDVINNVDVWVDLRNEGKWNRIVHLPSKLTYIRIPIEDGDLKRAKQVFTKAKSIIEASIEAGETVVLTCHAGMSRSVVLAWWILAEQFQDADKAWRHMKQLRPAIEPDERFFPFIEEHILPIRLSDNGFE